MEKNEITLPRRCSDLCIEDSSFFWDFNSLSDKGGELDRKLGGGVKKITSRALVFPQLNLLAATIKNENVENLCHFCSFLIPDSAVALLAVAPMQFVNKAIKRKEVV